MNQRNRIHRFSFIFFLNLLLFSRFCVIQIVALCYWSWSSSWPGVFWCSACNVLPFLLIFFFNWTLFVLENVAVLLVLEILMQTDAQSHEHPFVLGILWSMLVCLLLNEGSNWENCGFFWKRNAKKKRKGSSGIRFPVFNSYMGKNHTEETISTVKELSFDQSMGSSNP